MEQCGVVCLKCLLQQFNRVARFEQDGLDVFLELRPTGEAVFAGDYELCVVKAEALCSFNGSLLSSSLSSALSGGKGGRRPGEEALGMKLAHAIRSRGFAGEELFEELFGLFLELLEIRPRGQRF